MSYANKTAAVLSSDAGVWPDEQDGCTLSGGLSVVQATAIVLF